MLIREMHNKIMKRILLRIICAILMLSIFSTSAYASSAYPFMLHFEMPSTHYLLSDKLMEHVFTAPYTGEYEIFTTSNLDTCGILKQDQTLLDFDNDSGDGKDFLIRYFLTQGTTYKIFVSGFSSYDVGSYTLTAKLATQTYALRNIWQNKYLTASSSSTLTVGDFGYNRQLWEINSCDGEFSRIISHYYRSQLKTLTANSTSAYLSSLIGNSNQSFALTTNADGTYRIMCGNLALTVNNTSGSAGYGTEVKLAAYTGASNQKWAFKTPYAALGGMKDYPDENGIRCDFSTWINSESVSNAADIAGLYNGTFVSIITDTTPRELLKKIEDSYYFVISAHGSKYAIDTYNPETGYNELSTEYIKNLPSGYFKDTKCVLLNACSTGLGREQAPDNFVNTLHGKGVEVVVGFETEIEYYPNSTGTGVDGGRGCDLFSREFTKELANGATVRNAAKAAIKAVFDKEGDYHGTDSCYIAGNDNTVIKRPS